MNLGRVHPAGRCGSGPGSHSRSSTCRWSSWRSCRSTPRRHCRGPRRGFTTDWWTKAWEAEGPREAFVTSVKVALAATAVALVLGTLAAFALQRYKFFGRYSISFLLILPIALPGIVTAVALQNTFSRRIDLGPFDFQVGFGFHSLVIAHATFCVVLAYNNVVARLRRMSPNLLEASADLGAHGVQTFRHVTFPLVRSALLAGGILAFALSFDEIVVTTFTVGAGHRDAAPVDPQQPHSPQQRAARERRRHRDDAAVDTARLAGPAALRRRDRRDVTAIGAYSRRRVTLAPVSRLAGADPVRASRRHQSAHPRTRCRRSSTRSHSATATSRPTCTSPPTACSSPSTTPTSSARAASTPRSPQSTWSELRELRVDGREPDSTDERAARSVPRRPLQHRLQVRRRRSGPRAARSASATLLDRVCLGSFSHARLTKLRSLLGPDLLTCMSPQEIARLRLTGRITGTAQRVAQVPVHAGQFRRWGDVSPSSTSASSERAPAAASAVHVWTIDDPDGDAPTARPRRRRHHDRPPRGPARRARPNATSGSTEPSNRVASMPAPTAPDQHRSCATPHGGERRPARHLGRHGDVGARAATPSTPPSPATPPSP